MTLRMYMKVIKKLRASTGFEPVVTRSNPVEALKCFQSSLFLR